MEFLKQSLKILVCLKWQKKMVFKHIFYSAQAQDQLAQLKSYLCTNFIDDYFDGTSLTKDKGTPTLDENLISKIDDIDFSKPSFITLHQRASHSPFYDTYPKEFEIYNKDNIQDKTIDQNLINYLNSVRYTDYIIENIIKKISEKTNRPTYFIFTSDHSTSMEKSRNGHGRFRF